LYVLKISIEYLLKSTLHLPPGHVKSTGYRRGVEGGEPGRGLLVSRLVAPGEAVIFLKKKKFEFVTDIFFGFVRNITFPCAGICINKIR
jgi:hypothetical protein